MYQQRGITLIELLVVLTVILIIGSSVFASVGSLLENNQNTLTKNVVSAVVLKMENWPSKTLVLQNNSSVHLWDIDTCNVSLTNEQLEESVKDKTKHIIDGDPFLEINKSEAYTKLTPLKDKDDPKSFLYRGFAIETGFRQQNLNEKNEVVDAWNQPLHILWSTTLFGGKGIGVYSIGEDGIADPFNKESDDICSWRIDQ